MTPHYATERVTVYHGDCMEVLAEMADASVDAVVTDPPYGLGFMGKAWDTLPPGEKWAAECLRVLRPGGHLLAFGGTRTWHRLAVAVEDAGFEVRDSIAWLYGSGFPKSHDVSKAIDKAAGAERTEGARSWSGGGRRGGIMGESLGTQTLVKYDTPATPDAERWAGWGTALKPAFEPIVVGRKPLAGTVAANVLEHGTGALNIDGCRVGDELIVGRWPANVLLDDDQAEALDRQSGLSSSSSRTGRRTGKAAGTFGAFPGQENVTMGHDDTGGASRFFPTFRYQAKAPRAERPRVDGVAHPTVKPLALMRWLVRLVTPPGGVVLDTFAGSGTTAEAAVAEGFDCIAIESHAEYLSLIAARLERIAQTP